MKRLFLPRGLSRSLVMLPLLSALSATPAGAVPGGYLHVLARGAWACEQPGDATAPPVPVPQDSFRVIADSSYRTTDGREGSYLLLGNKVTMTTGPFKGRSYTLVGQGMLHPLDAQGQRTAERCVRLGAANGTGADTASDTAGPVNN